MASGTISEPQETYTLSQFISLRDADKIVYQRYAVMERSITYPTMVYAIDNVVYDYLDEMNKRKYVFNKDTMPKIVLAKLKNDAGIIGSVL